MAVGMELNFGMIGAERPDRGTLDRPRFRLAILGDFSGRAARGVLETGEALAKRRAIKLDIDTVEDVIAGFATTLVLPIGKDGAGIEVKLNGLDDLHPDELYDRVEMFDALSGLRRQLSSGATSARAAQSLKSWGEEFGRKVTPPRKSSRGNKVPASGRLSDFQKLIGGTAAVVEASPADDLIARIVGPHVRALPDPDVPAMQAAVDEALSDAMRLILHHPEFQSVEAQWRMLDLLARSIETGNDLDVVLFDISAEEIAADLAAADDMVESGLFGLFSEGTPDGRGMFSAIVGLYTFEETPPHAELMGRIARLAAHIDAPFFAAIGPGFMEVKKEDRHPLIAEAWDTLRKMPEAGYVGLATPRFLLRRPYGRRTDPISSFEFEEFSETEGLSGMLWANPGVFIAILLAQSFRKNGKAMKLGSIMQLGGQPYHFVLDQYGDQIQLPCTDRNMTQASAVKVIERGYMPVLTIKGRDEIRLAAFVALSGKIVLGPWAGSVPGASAPAASAAPAASSASGPASVGYRREDTPAEEDAGSTASDDTSDTSDSGDADLDALLAELDAGGGSEPAAEEAPAEDDELAALLASFDDATPDSDAAEGGDEEMDPELAALLASL